MEEERIEKPAPIFSSKVGAIGHPTFLSDEEFLKALKERSEAHVKNIYSRAKRNTPPSTKEE